MNVRRRDKSSPWPTVTILALALTVPVWILALASMITTRRRAMSLALTLPALAASAMVGSWWFLATHSVDSAGRQRARLVMAVSASFLRVYFLVVVPLVLFAIAAQRGRDTLGPLASKGWWLSAWATGSHLDREHRGGQLRPSRLTGSDRSAVFSSFDSRIAILRTRRADHGSEARRVRDASTTLRGAA